MMRRVRVRIGRMFVAADTAAVFVLNLVGRKDLGLRDVPDPYYGGKDGFDDVLNLVELASGRYCRDKRIGFGVA